MEIRRSVEADLPAMVAIINDAAKKYRGVIPADRWHEPYMPKDELLQEIAHGIDFWVAEDEGRVVDAAVEVTGRFLCVANSRGVEAGVVERFLAALELQPPLSEVVAVDLLVPLRRGDRLPRQLPVPE